MIVYFIRRPSDGAIKIGAASTSKPDVAHRLQQYVKSRWPRGELLARTRGYLVVERWFHLRHGAVALGHEWFSPSPLLLADLATLQRRSIDGQPEEPPAAMKIPGAVLRYCRKNIFGLPIEEFAALLGVGAAYVCYGERPNETRSMTLAANIEWAGRRSNVECPVSRVVGLIECRRQLAHHDRYRAHAVRSIEARQ